jgi:hypothetical protein
MTPAEKNSVKMVVINSRAADQNGPVWSIRFKRMAIIALGVFLVTLFLPTHYYVDTQAIAMPGSLQEVATVTGGRIQAIFAHPGEKVQRNQPLLQLENPDVAMRYEAAQTEYGMAQLGFAQAEDSSNPVQKSYACAQLNRMESAFAVREIFRNQFESLMLRAPMDGLIIATPSERFNGIPLERLKGIQMPPGAEVFLIGDADHYELTIPLQEAEALVVKNGDLIRARVVATGEVFETKLQGSVYRKALSSEYKPGFFAHFGGPAPQQIEGQLYPGERLLARDPERSLYPIYLADAGVPDDISATLSPYMRVRVRIAGERMLVIEKLIRMIRILFK